MIKLCIIFGDELQWGLSVTGLMMDTNPPTQRWKTLIHIHDPFYQPSESCLLGVKF